MTTAIPSVRTFSYQCACGLEFHYPSQKDGMCDLCFYKQPKDEDYTSAMRRQVSGTHYRDFKIQPVEFIHANDIGFIEGNIIKYICRWRAKGGLKDLEKVEHYIQILRELESKK